jgi:hypothetical protein
MRSILRGLVLSSAALCATAAFANDQARLDVPFNFVVKGHAYQAGSYKVGIDSGRSLVTLRNVKAPTQSLMWIVTPGDAVRNYSKVSMTFDVVGPDHVLRTIQYGAFVTPNLDARPKEKVERTRIIGE